MVSAAGPVHLGVVCAVVTRWLPVPAEGEEVLVAEAEEARGADAGARSAAHASGSADAWGRLLGAGRRAAPRRIPARRRDEREDAAARAR